MLDSSATTTTVTTTSSTTTTITTTSSTTTTTVTSTTTTSTTTTTTMKISAVAASTRSTYCGCSGFTLSLTNITFNTSGATYQWQSSPIGQYVWSNIGSVNSASSLSITSQGNSTDYQCLIYIINPSVTTVGSSTVTVLTTTNSDYCQTKLVNCACCGDDLNNFVLVGELGTQINDLNTGCAANSYDDRTNESVSLYQNMNYTAQVSTQYSGSEYFAIWIDFNDNFQFESSERVAYNTNIISSGTNVRISIPSISGGALTGPHRMRATIAYANAPNACGSSSTYGETHDYMVTILANAGKLYYR